MVSMNQVKSIAKRVWHFIWDSDSIWSWLLNVVLAFVIIKFLVYPGLGFLLQTSHPIVAVVSGSMEHSRTDSSGYICGQRWDGKVYGFDAYWDICGSWYEGIGIKESEFKEFPMRNGFNKGDIIVLVGREPDKLKVGDIIVFRTDRPDPIIHRIIAVDSQDSPGVKLYFQTKGDHNPDSFYFEKGITEEQIVGKALFKLPFLGYIKIWFVEFLRIMGMVQ